MRNYQILTSAVIACILYAVVELRKIHFCTFDMDTERVREAARSAARELGYTDLKQEKLRVVETFIQGRDVFGV